MKHLIYKLFGLAAFASGVALLCINLYGLTQNIRPDGLEGENLRFDDDLSLSYKEAIKSIYKRNQESDTEYMDRLTKVISKSLAHIYWEKESNITRYNQLVPVWDNYILYAMGVFSGIPEYQKYHFANYKRSLERGIGICGDASMIMSQLLSKYKISNQIITFPGHVVVAAQYGGTERVYDPDFGVSIPYSLDEFSKHAYEISNLYRDAGYRLSDVYFFRNIYKKEYQRWNGVSHFITNKYYFEYLAYALKWPLPIILVALGIFLINRKML